MAEVLNTAQELPLGAAGSLLPAITPPPLSLIQTAALRRRSTARPATSVAAVVSTPILSASAADALETAARSVSPASDMGEGSGMDAPMIAIKSAAPAAAPVGPVAEDPTVSTAEASAMSRLERDLPPAHADLAAQALRTLAAPRAQIQSVGPRPATERSIFKRVRSWVKTGLAIGAIAVSIGALHSTPAAQIHALPPMLSSGIPASVGALAASNQLPGLSSLIPALTSSAVGPVAQGPLNPALAAQAHSNDTSLIELPIKLDVNNPLDDQELSMALLPKDSFMALVVRVERLRLKVYYDPHENIGGGYCIDVREAVYGKERVRQDFKQAGLNDKQINSLLSHSRKENMTVTLTQEQALRLVMITKEDYRDLARNSIGTKIFDHLSPDRQNTLTYLAYNSNIARYKQLPQAIAKGRDLEAMSEMVPAFRNGPDQPLQMNYRLGSYLWAGWMGKLKDAISDPMHHEGLYANADGLSAFSRTYGLTAHSTHKAAQSVGTSGGQTVTHLPKAQMAARLEKHRKAAAAHTPLAVANASTTSSSLSSTGTLSGSHGMSARLAAQREQAAAVGADSLAVSGRSMADRNLQGF